MDTILQRSYFFPVVLNWQAILAIITIHNVSKDCHQQKLNILITTTFVVKMILDINILNIVANDYNSISLTVRWKKINMDIFALS